MKHIPFCRAHCFSCVIEFLYLDNAFLSDYEYSRKIVFFNDFESFGRSFICDTFMIFRQKVRDIAANFVSLIYFDIEKMTRKSIYTVFVGRRYEIS